MPDDSADGEGGRLAEGLEHAWAWFSVHATQRMQLVNYFIVACAFLVAGVIASVGADVPVGGCIVSLFGVFTVDRFWDLEKRTRSLVRIGRSALIELQHRLASDCAIPALELAALAEADTANSGHYSRSISSLYAGMALLFGSLAFLCAVLAAMQIL
ncbi:hypothetical protein [Williamsia muralis]|uniref:hypothetical protein n=1 Tax=Williamsia marianensis TaxID=85044 RepID=UPI00117E345A|nr:hypothetical protein [Williamsia marianensis]